MQACSIGIVLSKSGQEVLLIKRRDVPVWVLPGGGIETKESPEDAAIREVLEESGVHMQITRKAAHFVPVNSLSAHTHVYIGSIQAGSPMPSDESVDSQFFSLNALPKGLFELHKRWLKECLREKKCIHRGLREINYWNLVLGIIQQPRLALQWFFRKRSS